MSYGTQFWSVLKIQQYMLFVYSFTRETAMPINCMRDVLDAIKNNDVTAFKQEFPDFYANDQQLVQLSNVRNQLIYILQECAALQRAEIFDSVLTFCDEDQKEAAPLIWAAGGGSNIDHLLSHTIQIKHAQHALLVAIQSGQLNHVKVLLEPAQGMAGFLHPLWLAIYHKKMEIFNYLLTTSWLPKEHVQQWEQGWDDLLIAAATYNVPECVPQLLAHGSDPKAKRGLAMRFAGGHTDHLVFDLLYPLYPSSSIHEVIEDLHRDLPNNPHLLGCLQALENRISQEQHDILVESLQGEETEHADQEPKKM